jgi:phosphoribosylanthranilate isomerase
LQSEGRPNASVPELGGTGSVHDWSVSAQIVKAVPVPIILAGGLNPGNVETAISQVGPFGVDLCSGVRTNGELDLTLLWNFIESVRKSS